MSIESLGWADGDRAGVVGEVESVGLRLVGGVRRREVGVPMDVVGVEEEASFEAVRKRRRICSGASSFFLN